MKTMNKVLIAILLTASLAACNSGMSSAQGAATPIAPETNSAIYVSAQEFANLNKKSSYKKMLEIKANVLNQNKTYIFDFSSIESDSRLTLEKNLFGVSFRGNDNKPFVYVSSYKGKLLFTPALKLNLQQQSNMNAYLRRLTIKSKTITNKDSDDANNIPDVAFYINNVESIPASVCDFPAVVGANSNLPNGSGYTNECNPSFNLIYTVQLMRSFNVPGSNPPTPDAKIVNITIDSSDSGSGIHLAESLNTYIKYKDAPYWAGYDLVNWSTSPIVRQYVFTVSGSGATNGNITPIISSFTPQNTDAWYSASVSSSYTIGGSAGGEISETPKLTAGGNASFTQSNSLNFSTNEYAISTISPAANTIQFIWQRQQYATSQDLLNPPPFPDLNNSELHEIPANINSTTISPLAYANFVPSFDVVFTMNPESSATTSDFQINTQVYALPYYFRVISDVLWWTDEGVNDSVTNNVMWKSNNAQPIINIGTSFTVDWNNPVFLGGWPVNLQLADFNNSCLETSESSNGTVTVGASNCATDGIDLVNQGFIYDQYGRYVSIQYPEYCLDSTSITTPTLCDLRLSQRWTWSNSNSQLPGQLISVYQPNGQQQAISYDNTTAALSVSPVNNQSSSSSENLLTTYISSNLFHN